jgi:hypothetical protein
VRADEEDVQDAVYELHQYLSDQKAPLMVADSVALLLQYPAKFLAAQILAWVAGQPPAAPLSDYLYHSAKKIHLLGEFELLPRDGLPEYLSGLSDELIEHCPAADREVLRGNLRLLGQAAPSVGVAAATLLHRQHSDPAVAQPVSAAGERRMALLLEHLRPLASAPAEQRQALAAQFMTSAALRSSSGRELDDQLARLGQLGVGIGTATDQVFRTIAASLAGWVLPSAEGLQAPTVSREQLDAMRQIVSLAEDPAVAARRFREMVHAAIEQFNDGQLGRAATMFELAERLAQEKKVQQPFVDALRTQGHEYLNEERLRQLAERGDTRAQLRVVLCFFTALQPPGLLHSLNGEPRRDRRRQLLALLEVHEQAARAAAWELLRATVQDPGCDPFFQMNLVYLLRIIPRPEAASVEDEVNVLMQTSGRSSPPPLVKQVIAYLANGGHEKAERALMTYLRVFESMLVQPETAVYPVDELMVLLDRTCAALARYGTPRAWKLLVDHGLKSDTRLGCPYLRLSEAAHCDLSRSRELVERILATIRLELPRPGVLGMMAKSNEERAVAMVQALAGTPLPEVRLLLKEIAGKHAGRRIAEAAARALSALDSVGKPPPPPPGISGDLELFGLPNLLQTLAQSQFSGVLTVMDGSGRPVATLLIEAGVFRGGECGAIKGTEALYQLFERPFPGTFAFVSRTDVGAQWHLGPEQPLLPLIFEGVRRYDELIRAVAIAPDHARLKPTGTARTPVADEDPAFTSALWSRISPEKTIAECEATMGVDAYRVRRALAHWIDEGVLATA